MLLNICNKPQRSPMSLATNCVEQCRCAFPQVFFYVPYVLYKSRIAAAVYSKTRSCSYGLLDRKCHADTGSVTVYTSRLRARLLLYPQQCAACPTGRRADSR